MLRYKCPKCKAYDGHSPLCEDIDLDSAKKQLKQYYELWLNREMETRKRESISKERESRAYKHAQFWEGKFKIVKHENNQLRKKLKL